MSSSRSIAAVLAAGLLAASACSDSTAPAPRAGAIAASPAAPVTLYGIISRTGRDPLHGVTLKLDDGSSVALATSSETYALAGLDGAGIEVKGIWDSEAFDVSSFVVRQINGGPVFDGVLVEETNQDATDTPVTSYRLQPSDGSDARLIAPSAEMLQHVGSRMWVRLDDNGDAAEFGIIGG